MLDNIKIKNILFLDIETVPQYDSYRNVPFDIKKLWIKKSKTLRHENSSPSDLYKRAGIYAEFGKIICISVGIIIGVKNKYRLKLRSFSGDDESKLLQEFIDVLNSLVKKRKILLCAHNGKEFDFPFIARRILINNLILPTPLDSAGKKPWQINQLDTLELWKFGDYKHYTSLELLTTIFRIPSPKDDICGSEVANVFWKDNNLARIVKYCEKDVFAIACLMLKYKGLKIDSFHIEA